MGKIYVVGFGPGAYEQMTERARFAIENSDTIIGYKTYVDIVSGLISDKQIVRTGMTEEVSRAQEAVKLAKAGNTVAVISSGESGIYGMAGLVYEVLIEQGWKPGDSPEIEVVPGVPALASCASLLGAPLMHDFVSISLSDHLTPWEVIAKRVEAAGMGDFVVVLYNPKSGRRTRQIEETQRILLKYRSPDTPVGLVKSAFREAQHVVVTTLEDMLNYEIGMLTTVIIGNSSTFNYHDLIVTPRGYQRKYTLSRDGGRMEGQPRGLAPSPWSLDATAPIHPEFLPELEVAVSPGVANKNFTSFQMMELAKLAGDTGTITYTPGHELILKIPGGNPDEVSHRLAELGLLVSPVGLKAQLVACDFCEGEKTESIPYAEELYRLLHGEEMPNELKIGFNGCAMACYGAVMEDIGVVFRRGFFELYLGGKRGGCAPHPGQKVAEGIPPENVVEIVKSIVTEYKQNAHPKERFHKYMKRTGEVAGYLWDGTANAKEVEPVCGD
ncbi:precorrin-3B C(17)-methyltransferase [Effusibacillus lacus]|uniref:Precorrin-3B C(17)-methyltransferase n=1 Tax=Effusibacillus lacus TaxID=1348429 RepID=A0A292YRD2_9BACL|nr:precorrin-3B C(17)-methyltransferase [Effusibacillus lacus]TCS75701.1 cobalt-precorrin 3 C17-methyltransferase [Effusibacillus lacus]GAX91020.1 precorrin-3B C(17)-methyltransferase [Effusibacillus lacus]